MRPNHIFAFDANPFLTVFLTASLEDALQNTLKNYHPRLESNPRAEFYNKLKREADEYDGEFLNKHSGDLNITLIFVSLPAFSHLLLSWRVVLG